jgi:hypothetical protein
MLIPIGCIIIPFPGFPMVDWANVAPAVAEVTGKAKELSKESGEVVLAAADVVLRSALLATWNDINSSERGVAYATGNGDYAEWIPRVNSKEEMHAGQIVAVRRGQLSLRTDEFDHLLVISSAPAVLGKMPADADTDDYEKVAFLGQVPVELIGTAKSGDYILPSGDHDGFGIAVDPADIAPDQIPYIVGVAWEDGTNEFYNIVNVVVGLDHSATAHRFTELRKQLDDLRADLTDVEALVAVWGAPAAPAAEEELAALPAEAGFFRRWWRGTGSRQPEAFVAESTRTETTAAPAEPSMLVGMSKDEIVAAVEDAKNGKTPAAWQNVNSKELSTILQTVVDTYVEHAEGQAIAQAQQIKQETLASFPQQLSSALGSYGSVEDIVRMSEQRAMEYGMDPAAMRDVEHRFAARILDSQLTTTNIQQILRGAPEVLAGAGNIKPGTVAEARYIEQIQTEIARALAKESPEIAKHMTLRGTSSTAQPARK